VVCDDKRDGQSSFENVFFLNPLFENQQLREAFYFGLVFLWDWGLNSWQALYYLNHTSSPFHPGYFWRWDLENYLPGLASNYYPSNLSFSSS
jgi:hypothetical protein